MANQSAESSPPRDFEGDLKLLEGIIAQMEGGKLTLEEALAHFEQGVHLARRCQQALQDAEQRVQTLMSEHTHPNQER